MIYGWIPKPGLSPRGSGKTGGLVWKLYQEKLKGRMVVSNLDSLTFGDVVVDSSYLSEMPPDFHDLVLGTTEVHQFLEARRSMRTKQLQIGYVLGLQLRKRRITWHWDSQSVEQVDSRIIRQTDYLIHCENLGCGDRTCTNQACDIETCGAYHYEVFDAHVGRYLSEFWLNGPRDFYNLYDTEEVTMDVGDDPETE